MSATANLRRRLGSLGLGILILGGVVGFAFFVSSDFRLIYALGAILLFCSAIWLSADGKPDWLAIALLAGPLIAGFGLLIFVKMPVLWPHLLLWLIAAIVGSLLLAAGRSRRILPACGAGLFVIVSLWYGIGYLPKLVARSLTHFQNAPAPTFAFQPVSDGPVPIGPVAGKVLVIDFFSTTCGPCIAELPELARVRADLQDKADIEFVVVASDASGDTPERFRSFILRRHVSLPLAYDLGGKAHAVFRFTGVPALVVLDRAGRVRLTHEGYNASEMNFRRDLVQFLETL